MIILPFLQASVANVRVLNIRTDHSHLSILTFSGKVITPF
jgi:hypothetical protein